MSDNDNWQDVANQIFGKGESSNSESYELTEREHEMLRIDCRTWVDPMKFMVYKNAVIRYVTTHRSGFDYPCCYGIYDNPHAALEAILNSEEYKSYLGFNAQMPSVVPLVQMSIKHGQYTFARSGYIELQCERAIAYWEETGGTNRKDSQ